MNVLNECASNGRYHETIILIVKVLAKISACFLVLENRAAELDEEQN